jgi:Family of unknown function (DUF6535)
VNCGIPLGHAAPTLNLLFMSNPAETAREVKKDDETRMVDEIEKDAPVELETGVSGEREQLPGVPKEYSGWDVYNNEAKKVDTELVNDWRDSLNSLLLFVSINFRD